MEVNLFPKFLDNAISPVATSVGNTLSSVWDIVFGGIDSYSEKIKYKRNYNVEQFRQELDSKVSAIPEEKLVEPPLHIIGPTLEASKFYFENEELRSMFANLIASSINIDSIKNIHPSFVEVIKQLSPDEAKIIKYLKRGNFGFINVNFQLEKGGKYTLVRNFSEISFLANCEKPEDITVYLDNLDRLSLIQLDKTRMITDKNLYERLFQHPLIQTAIEYSNELGKPVIEQGYAESTLFGINFYKACIED